MSLKSNLRNRQISSLANNTGFRFPSNSKQRLPELIPNSDNLTYSTWLNMQITYGTRPVSWAENKLKVLKQRRAKNKARKVTNSKKRK